MLILPRMMGSSKKKGLKFPKWLKALNKQTNNRSPKHVEMAEGCNKNGKSRWIWPKRMFKKWQHGQNLWELAKIAKKSKWTKHNHGGNYKFEYPGRENVFKRVLFVFEILVEFAGNFSVGILSSWNNSTTWPLGSQTHTKIFCEFLFAFLDYFSGKRITCLEVALFPNLISSIVPKSIMMSKWSFVMKVIPWTRW